MGVLATTFDTLEFFYIMRLNIIAIRNDVSNISANNMHSYLLQLRLPDVIQDKPAIHMLHHRIGRPLDIFSNGNHFTYLKLTL